MDVIDRIQRAIRNPLGFNRTATPQEQEQLIAFLDRLREPTPEMKKALLDAPGPFTPVYFAQVFIAAAQEGL